MERSHERDLEILTAIAEGRPLTQRALAARVGIALGLANLYLKRLSRKGYIKIAQFPRKPAARKRLTYLLTPKGITEKTRLTYEHIAYSLNLYRRTRHALRAAMESLVRQGAKRIALYGANEAAELAYLTLKEFGVEPLGVFAREASGAFLGFAVQDVRDLLALEFDAIVVATFDRPEPEIEWLAGLGFPRDRFLTLRRLAAEETQP
jgi:DNA-binding MarR family transcriptional regulator